MAHCTRRKRACIRLLLVCYPALLPRRCRIACASTAPPPRVRWTCLHAPPAHITIPPAGTCHARRTPPHHGCTACRAHTLPSLPTHPHQLPGRGFVGMHCRAPNPLLYPSRALVVPVLQQAISPLAASVLALSARRARRRMNLYIISGLGYYRLHVPLRKTWRKSSEKKNGG